MQASLLPLMHEAPTAPPSLPLDPAMHSGQPWCITSSKCASAAGTTSHSTPANQKWINCNVNDYPPPPPSYDYSPPPPPDYSYTPSPSHGSSTPSNACACVFPFTFNQISYSKCTTVGSTASKPWCQVSHWSMTSQAQPPAFSPPLPFLSLLDIVLTNVSLPLFLPCQVGSACSTYGGTVTSSGGYGVSYKWAYQPTSCLAG